MKEFKILSEMLGKIHSIFIKANHYFVIWQSLEKLINPNDIGIEKAKQNLDTMNRFKSFFKPIIDSSKDIYILELAKCFDSDREALSILTVLAFIKNNISELNYENYIAYSGKSALVDRKQDFPIPMELVEELSKKIKGKSKVIRRLINFRNGYLGHNQINPNKDSRITIGETEELMKLLMEIGNTLSHHLFRETYWHIFSNKNTHEEIDRMLDFLNRFESYRLQEIKQQSEQKITEYKRRIK